MAQPYGQPALRQEFVARSRTALSWAAAPSARQRLAPRMRVG
ncbi:hypothetical protein [Actinomadura kijaniata]|nr:hypothetical protein [Actinomadura kijaniata]